MSELAFESGLRVIISVLLIFTSYFCERQTSPRVILVHNRLVTVRVNSLCVWFVRSKSVLRDEMYVLWR